MRVSMDLGLLPDPNLKTRSFSEIGDASWLLNQVEECLECRHAYDRQDLLDLIKQNDSLSFTVWEGDQAVGLIGKILPRHGRRKTGRCFRGRLGTSSHRPYMQAILFNTDMVGFPSSTKDCSLW